MYSHHYFLSSPRTRAAVRHRQRLRDHARGAAGGHAEAGHRAQRRGGHRHDGRGGRQQRRPSTQLWLLCFHPVVALLASFAATSRYSRIIVMHAFPMQVNWEEFVRMWRMR